MALIGPKRRQGALFFGIGMLALAAAAVANDTRSVGAATPQATATATASPAHTATPVNCTTTGTTACLAVSNSSSGIGVAGTSASGTGLRGTSTSNNGLKATSGSFYGVYGGSTSGGAGVFGTMASGVGVLGTTTGNNGYGVEGSSASGYGVFGSTTSGAGNGVVGLVSGGGTGTYGGSSSGYGLEGISSSGDAAFLFATESGTALVAESTTGYGVSVSTGGATAVYARNSSGNGSDVQGSYIGLLGRSPTNGFPLVLTDTSGNNLFYVDGNGNVSYKGSLASFARTRSGSLAKAYSPKTTEPTIEDTGTAQLLNGAALVALDKVFASSIDTTHAYRVFITPDGDSHGLYVANKTPSGFVVREQQGGRSSIAFDYRIVADSAEHVGERMALEGSSTGRAPNATPPVVPAQKFPGFVKPARVPKPESPL